MRAALAMVLVLVLAGCGGDDSLSRGEWAARANAICLEALKKVEALGRPSTSDDYLRVTPKANELGRAAIDRLRELKASGESEADSKAMIDGYERVIALQERVIDAFRAYRAGGEFIPQDVRRLENDAIEAGRAADEIAGRLRTHDCAREPWQAPSQP